MMPKPITIEQAYDIAYAFITDKNTSIEKRFSQVYYTCYTLKAGNLRLDIYAPHSGSGYDWLDDYYFKNNGSIDLYRDGHTIMFHHTKYNVGHAMNKSRFNPIRCIVRMRESRFFKILDLAQERTNGNIKTIDNTIRINNLIQQITEKHK